MNDERKARSLDAIIRVVQEILESEGYDALQPRVVAKRARVSLTTIYRFAPTRDELIVAALARWMTENGIDGRVVPPSGLSPRDGLMWVYRKLFESWEKSPRMLEAYYRARAGPGGERVDRQSGEALEPVARAFLEKLDPALAADVGPIMTNLVCGAIHRCAIGEIEVTEILPMLERTLFRLTSDNESLAAAGTRRGRRTTRRRKK